MTRALIQPDAWIWGCIINRDPNCLRDKHVQNSKLQVAKGALGWEQKGEETPTRKIPIHPENDPIKKAQYVQLMCGCNWRKKGGF